MQRALPQVDQVERVELGLNLAGDDQVIPGQGRALGQRGARRVPKEHRGPVERGYECDFPRAPYRLLKMKRWQAERRHDVRYSHR